MSQDKIKHSDSLKMSFPDYLNGIINHHSKHRQVEQIKEEIKKMIPFPSINNQEKSSHNQTTAKLNERKTVGNFFHQPTSKIFLSLESRPAFYSSTQKEFRPAKLNKKQSQPAKPTPFYQQNSNEEEDQAMKQWRQQMMRHIKQKKIMQYKTIETQSKLIQKQKQKQKEKDFLSPKLHKVKTAPAHLKKKHRSTTKPIFVRTQQANQKNIILIKPTLIQQEKSEKPINRNRIQPLKIKKTLTFDRFYNNNYFQKDSDQLTLQKIANFQALLPFLGAKKATVEKKEEKKQAIYEIRLSLEQQIKKKRISKEKQMQFKQKITGWETNYD